MTSPAIPDKMHAVQYKKTGPVSVLEYVEVPVSRVTSRTVLVQIKANGLNPIDYKIRKGNIPGAPTKLPCVPGGDYSGVIVAKGDQVTEFEVGDAVFGTVALPSPADKGASAEYCLIRVGKDAIAKKPENVSFEEAAGVGVAGLTAYTGLADYGHLKPNQRVLIVGASGGVGTYAVQVAKHGFSADVTAICSGRNAALVTELGADRIVDYTLPEALKNLVAEKPTFDVILDCVGGDNYYNQLSPLLSKKGWYVTAAGPIEHSGSKPLSFTEKFYFGSRLLARYLFCRYRFILGLPYKDLASGITPLMSEGKVKTIYSQDDVYDLKDCIKAYERLESHRAVGKVIMRT